MKNVAPFEKSLNFFRTNQSESSNGVKISYTKFSGCMQPKII